MRAPGIRRLASYALMAAGSWMVFLGARSLLESQLGRASAAPHHVLSVLLRGLGTQALRSGSAACRKSDARWNPDGMTCPEDPGRMGNARKSRRVLPDPEAASLRVCRHQ